MKFGFAPLNNAEGPRPDRLCHELEVRGFDSVWMPEHTHIPVSRDTTYVGGGDLPRGYYGMMNPFVSLAAGAVATDRLTLATGVCQVLEHDLIDLATTVATLDQVSAGRVVLGVGAGWNREELANHRPDIPFSRRYRAVAERIEALRTIWSSPVPEFDGTWDRFTASHIDPKPVRGAVPVALGLSGPIGLELSARAADEWIPIDAFLRGADGRPDVGGCVRRFRDAVERAGRAPDTVPIRVFYSGPVKRRRLDAFAAAGVAGLVFLTADLHDGGTDATMRRLDEIADQAPEFADG